MRFISLFKKSLAENFRDWKILILGITFAPFFVVLMFLYLGSSPQTFHLIFLNHDKGMITSNGDMVNSGQELVDTLISIYPSDGSVILKVKLERDLITAKELLKEHKADLIVEIPENFSKTLSEFRLGSTPSPEKVKTYGDPSNLKYIMAATWGHAMTYHFTTEITGIKGPFEIEDITISPKKTLSDFDLYVPALLTLALMMLMFTGAGSIIKEKDKGTIVRLRISNMRAVEWFAACSLTQVIIGLLAMALTYLTAYSVGYTTNGSLFAMFIVGGISCLSIMAISLVVAAFLRTIFDLVTIGCFPFFILMFFSGGMFPLPELQLVNLGSHTFYVNDLLPTTHTISAFGKIMNYGADLGDILFEITAIIILTLLFFTWGGWLFSKRHLKHA